MAMPNCPVPTAVRQLSTVHLFNVNLLSPELQLTYPGLGPADWKWWTRPAHKCMCCRACQYVLTGPGPYFRRIHSIPLMSFFRGFLWVFYFHFLEVFFEFFFMIFSLLWFFLWFFLCFGFCGSTARGTSGQSRGSSSPPLIVYCFCILFLYTVSCLVGSGIFSNVLQTDPPPLHLHLYK